MTETTKPLKVKFAGIGAHKRQIPSTDNIYMGLEFTFDKDEQNYDWLVVYNDLAKIGKERFSSRNEKLSGAKENTLLLTTEPPNIKSYGSYYTEQFGYVLTSHDKKFLSHPNRIFSVPPLFWFYGIKFDIDKGISFEEVKNKNFSKTKIISTVCSSKKQKHTLHNKRYEFTQELKNRLPELDIYGHGVKNVNDKAEAMDDYKYHLAIENFIGEHHWTEKLADSFLAGCLPFYCGAPNAGDYFPKDSFIPIDIFDIDKSERIIKEAIANNEYEKRLPAIMQARDMILHDYNTFTVIANIIHEKNGKPNSNKKLSPYIKARHVAMYSSFKNLLSHIYQKYKSRLYFFFTHKN